MPENEKEKTTITKSNAQLDLERRTADGYVPDSDVSGVVTVNPNPFGNDAYVGTDPIYQNYSTDQNKAFESKEGVEAELLKEYKKEHEVDDSVAVEDFGLGGKAQRAASGTGGATYRTILPGQEGYDLKKAEEQNGPPLRVFNDDEADSSDDEATEVPNPGTNLGGTTEPPAPGAGPTDRSGSRDGSK